MPAALQIYIYNDLPYSRAARPHDGRFLDLLAELAAALRSEPYVHFIEMAEQLDALAGLPVAAPFTRALAIGNAGRRVADELHARTGWFPVVETLSITREEIEPGCYRVVSLGGMDPAPLLQAVDAASLAVVDDTLYSGLTLTWVLTRLRPAVLAHTRVFCLQAIAEALPAVRRFCPVSAGLEMPGRVEEDVTIIKASHLFERGAIRRSGGTDLAFFERPAWMDAWFPHLAARITALCAMIDGHLRSHG